MKKNLDSGSICFQPAGPKISICGRVNSDIFSQMTCFSKALDQKPLGKNHGMQFDSDILFKRYWILMLFLC